MQAHRFNTFAFILPLLLSCWLGIGAAQADGIGTTVTPAGEDASVMVDCGSGDGCNKKNVSA